MPSAVIGHVRATKGTVTVGAGIPVAKKADLYPGDLLVVGSSGEAEVDLTLKKTNCTVGRNTQLRVLPSVNVAFQILSQDGDLICGTASRSRQVEKVNGGGFEISVMDSVFAISVRQSQATIKVDQGSLIVTGRTGRRRGVVLARKQQSVVPIGGDPRAPRPITLTPRERALFAALELRLGLSAPSDTSRPNTKILAGPEHQTTSSTATFIFAASERGVVFSCSLDGADFHICSSPAILSGLSVGHHIFAVRGTDMAGNAGSVQAYAWQITATLR